MEGVWEGYGGIPRAAGGQVPYIDHFLIQGCVLIPPRMGGFRVIGCQISGGLRGCFWPFLGTPKIRGALFCTPPGRTPLGPPPEGSKIGVYNPLLTPFPPHLGPKTPYFTPKTGVLPPICPHFTPKTGANRPKWGVFPGYPPGSTPPHHLRESSKLAYFETKSTGLPRHPPDQRVFRFASCRGRWLRFDK